MRDQVEGSCRPTQISQSDVCAAHLAHSSMRLSMNGPPKHVCLILSNSCGPLETETQGISAGLLIKTASGADTAMHSYNPNMQNRKILSLRPMGGGEKSKTKKEVNKASRASTLSVCSPL